MDTGSYAAIRIVHTLTHAAIHIAANGVATSVVKTTATGVAMSIAVVAGSVGESAMQCWSMLCADAT